MILIDAMMLAHRCHAKMDFLTNDAGNPTGLEFGFLRTVESLQKKYPDAGTVALCWEGGRSARRAYDPRYKANRMPLEESVQERLRTLRQFARMFYLDAASESFEADDAMFSLSREAGPHVVYTNDSDLLQAVDDERNVTVVKSFKSKLYEWREADVRAKYGVRPADLPVYRAFVGDASDNLPGISRVSKAYVAALINWCRDVNPECAPEWIVEQIKTAEWPASTRAAVVEFVDSGRARENYELMALHRIPVSSIKEDMREDFAVACLTRWQIRTLRLCEQFRTALAASMSEEF